MTDKRRIYLATSNPGKVREFQEAAEAFGLELAPVPGLKSLPLPVEDGVTFEENAKKKAEYYSRHAAAELVLAEDSGLAVEALEGAPGVYSARYAAVFSTPPRATTARTAIPDCAKAAQSGSPGIGDPAVHTNSTDEENNRALIHELERRGNGNFAAKYVSVIALARGGQTIATFTGEAHGEIVTTPRGSGGFGYDPLFYFPALRKTFAELPLEEKRRHSHRGQAFRKFLEWWKNLRDR